MDTSRKQPSPVVARPARAATIASAAVRPPTRVADREADPQRRGLRRAGDAHHAGQALDDLVVGGRLAHRAGLAEAADRAVDEPRVELAQHAASRTPAGPARRPGSSRPARRRRSTSPRTPARSPGSLRSSSTDFLPAFWARNDAPSPASLSSGSGPEMPGEVTLPGHLHLHDLGAEQRELVGAVRPGEDVGQVEHPDAGERSVAACAYSLRAPAGARCRRSGRRAERDGRTLARTCGRRPA